MSNLVGCALFPHPPIMVPEVGGAEVAKITATVQAAQQAGETLVRQGPQTLVLITPHGPLFEDAVTVSVYPRLQGSLEAFGAPEVALGLETDGLLVRHILQETERLGVNVVAMTDERARTYRIPLVLDHGALVPLYYLAKAGYKGLLVHMSVGLLPYEEMYTLGKAVQKAVDKAGKPAAVVASGDLSHRLLPGAPAGYHPRGREFDQAVVAALRHMDAKALFNMERQLIDDAGECGLRSIFFAMGAMGGLSFSSQVLSYEGPFGVGYAVAVFLPQQRKGGRES